MRIVFQVRRLRFLIIVQKETVKDKCLDEEIIAGIDKKQGIHVCNGRY
jgi:hypothetical protein